jgi:hypothetical protein
MVHARGGISRALSQAAGYNEQPLCADGNDAEPRDQGPGEERGKPRTEDEGDPAQAPQADDGTDAGASSCYLPEGERVGRITRALAILLAIPEPGDSDSE